MRPTSAASFLSSRQLFISDLHLETARPDITRTLLQFLLDQQGACTDLFILGDLFEVWIGDDDPSPLAETVATALHQFSAAGAKVHLMHGNRDFLLGADYARRCGADLIQEPYLLATASSPVLLLHGDILCRDDADYQQFRLLVRAPAWQQEFLARSLVERREFADQARQQSRSATASKAMDIMDVNPQAVEELLQSKGQLKLLHGHTHRPAIHQLDLANGEQATRIVLGSWEQQAWYASSDDSGIQLHHFPLLGA